MQGATVAADIGADVCLPKFQWNRLTLPPGEDGSFVLTAGLLPSNSRCENIQPSFITTEKQNGGEGYSYLDTQLRTSRFFKGYDSEQSRYGLSGRSIHGGTSDKAIY
jgi:hypothetical protein